MEAKKHRWLTQHLKRAINKARKKQGYLKKKFTLAVSTFDFGAAFRVHVTTASLNDAQFVKNWVENVGFSASIHDGIGGGFTVSFTVCS